MDPMMVSVDYDRGRWLFLLAAIGMLVGFAWLHRITSMGEDPDRSFSRMNRRRRGGSLRFHAPGTPTRGWLLTRGAILIGVGAVAFAFVGPQVMRPWDRGAIALLTSLSAVVSAIVGTAWMIRIAVRAPDDGGPAWRSRR